MVDRAGYSAIPNAIIAEMPNMSAPEAVCTLILAAATYGGRRRSARLTYKDFMERTMLASDKAITKALAAIAGRGFFRRTGRSTWEIAKADHDSSPERRQAQVQAAAAVHGAGQLSAAPPGLESSFWHLNSSFGEANTCPRTANACPGTANTCPRTMNSCPYTVNGSSTEFSAIGGTESVPSKGGSGTKSEPLPYRKEIDPLVGDLERERKKKGSDREEARACEGKPSLSPRMPRPRTAEEQALAAHPATTSWLASGLDWPGWVRLKAITRRMGERPQGEMLQRAYEMWLLHGYRASNIQGILDWYEALCRDEQWQPYPTSGPLKGPVQSAGSGNQQGLELLLRMREERLRERLDEQNDNSGLPHDAAVGLYTQ